MNILVTAHEDKFVRVFDIVTGKLLFYWMSLADTHVFILQVNARILSPPTWTA